MTSDPNKQVIITQPGETLGEAKADIPAELVGLPQHTWRSKAEELLRLSNRRKAIVRRLIVDKRILTWELEQTNRALGIAERAIHRGQSLQKSLQEKGTPEK